MRTASDQPGRRLLDRILSGVQHEDTADDGNPLRHVTDLPARPEHTVAWPEWAPQEVVSALQRRGAEYPWHHQSAGAEAVRAGEHVVVATGTASGKSLVYQLPVLSALRTEEQATALYLAPTKALSADQLRSINGLELDGIRAANFDGDTARGERDWARAHGRWIFTNPDMLHHGILPGQDRKSVV